LIVADDLRADEHPPERFAAAEAKTFEQVAEHHSFPPVDPSVSIVATIIPPRNLLRGFLTFERFSVEFRAPRRKDT
jgi:hypothetical protein